MIAAFLRASPPSTNIYLIGSPRTSPPGIREGERGFFFELALEMIKGEEGGGERIVDWKIVDWGHGGEN